MFDYQLENVTSLELNQQTIKQIKSLIFTWYNKARPLTSMLTEIYLA